MKKLLIVVDVQNDFVDGALGTPEAKAIIPNVVNKIKDWDGDIFCTQDTHREDYLSTREGKNLPVVHCVEGTDGHKINEDVFAELCEYLLEVLLFRKSFVLSDTIISSLSVCVQTYVSFQMLCFLRHTSLKLILLLMLLVVRV